MAASRSNRSSAPIMRDTGKQATSPVTRNTGTDVRAPVYKSIQKAPAPVVPRPVVRSKPIANPVAKAREIAVRSKTPIEKARATISPVLPVRPIIPEPVPTPRQPFGCGTPGAGDWGLAAARNADLRENSKIIKGGKVVFVEPPFWYVNVMLINPQLKIPTPQAVPCPNPKFIAQIPPKPPIPDLAAPITESIISKVVDKIIEDSKEVVKEVESKQEPVREPVVITQDLVRPPAPITPVEVVLQNGAACQKDVIIPTINIVNEINVDLDFQAGDIAVESYLNIEIAEEIELVGGCTDPDALNYDPAAQIQVEGSCVYEPPPEEEVTSEPEPDEPVVLNIPEYIPFMSSHGEVLFTVPKSLIEDSENSGTPSMFTLPSKVKIEADLTLVEGITRSSTEDSDIIVSEEPVEVSNKKGIREIVGGELASDNVTLSEKDVIIYGDREKIKTELIRNKSGVIILSTEEDTKIGVAMRCQSFKYKKYKKHINTEISELLGKL